MKSSIITLELVKNIIERRNREIHKGDCGRILIVAGTTGMAGAAVLSATSAFRAGAGLVQVFIPKELFPIVQCGIPEATCVERNLSKLNLLPYDAMAIGPGLSRSKESVELVETLLSNFTRPMVIDADALNIIAENNLFHLIKDKPLGSCVITPHLGEAERLLGKKIGKDKVDRQKAAIELCEKTGAIALLKGHNTILTSCVSSNQYVTYTNTTGNPGMATAGSGDVLTGIIAGLLGQKKADGNRLTTWEAAICGAFIHGMAGDLAAEAIGEYGLMAGDIAFYTAMALKQISG